MVDCFNAPIAKHDIDDFGDFQSTDCYSNKIKEDLLNDNNFFPEFNPLNEGSMHASLENLVNSFDETISKCFSISEEKLDSVSPMYGSTPENSVFDKSRLWYKITGNLGNIVPLEWSKSRIFQLQTASLHLIDKEDTDNQNLDLPDDDELIAAFDHHSLITPRLPDGMEPLKSADEIINEIDQIMGEDDLDTPTDAYGFIVPDSDSFIIRREFIERPPNWEEELQKLSIRQLNEYLEELESSIRDFSANLVEQLAIREELDFEKEQKDRFVSLVHGIHKRLEAKGLPSTTNLGSQKRAGRSVNSKTNNTAKKKPTKNGIQPPGVLNKSIDPASDKEFQILTTTIPYHQCSFPPNTDLLQTFNEILTAMTSNNPNVSGLLTDYILNVYAPAEKLAPPALP